MSEKHKVLYESCVEAGYACALQSFENVVSAWLEERSMERGYSIYNEESISKFMDEYGAWIGFPTKDDVEVNFADQSSEYLFGGDQADVIYIDKEVFPEFNGENHWAVLDKYFGTESVPIVEKAFEEGLQSFFKKYFNDSNSPASSTLVCRNSNFLLEVEVVVNAHNIDELTVESFGEDLKDILNENSWDDLQSMAFNTICGARGKLDADELGNELVESVVKYLDELTSGNLFIVRDGYEEEPIPNDWLIDVLRAYYEDSSTFYPFAGEGVIRCVTEFLNEGKWHLGYDEENKPFLWFGLDSTDPLDIWSLPFISDNDYSSWKTIWFRDFWDLDWNAILGDSGENCIIWMFSEMCMDEPTEERDMVRNECPIELTEEDTQDSIIRKIQLYAKANREL